jgi:hypothetical protein
MAAWAGPGDDTDEEIRLCRIEYLGDDDWGFAPYDPATETYEPAVLPGGQPSAAPSRPTTPPPSSTSPNTRSNETARRAPIRDYCAAALVAGDKSGQWRKWYRTAIPRAEQLYDDYLAGCRKEMGQ